MTKKYRLIERSSPKWATRYVIQEYWRPFWPFPYEWVDEASYYSKVGAVKYYEDLINNVNQEDNEIVLREG